MWWRIFYGFLRLILGVTLLKTTGKQLSDFIFGLMSHEITGKASDAVLGKMYNFFEIHDFTVTYFLALYFIFWGIVDIVLSLCLLRHIKRVFPISMGIIALFITYGIVRLTFTHSIILLCVILLDIVILYLINIEYKKITSNISKHSDPLHHQS